MEQKGQPDILLFMKEAQSKGNEKNMNTTEMIKWISETWAPRSHTAKEL